uniref:Uncharacterized protein n=1 Tax=Aegilops tauschii subsp. strangulata TaxID=200361 RepID=A0A452Z134_AEGTS
TVNYEIGNLIKWRKNFGNVVLIMHVSGPVDRVALEWRLLYGRIFKTVIILAEHSNAELAVERCPLSHAYKYLPKVFARYGGADGFLFLQDHMILNYWNLLQADKEKLWITDKRLHILGLLFHWRAIKRNGLLSKVLWLSRSLAAPLFISSPSIKKAWAKIRLYSVAANCSMCPDSLLRTSVILWVSLAVWICIIRLRSRCSSWRWTRLKILIRKL